MAVDDGNKRDIGIGLANRAMALMPIAAAPMPAKTCRQTRREYRSR